MPEEASHDPATVVTEVREQARRLAGELPGALRRIQVRSGEVEVEVEWQLATVATAPVNGHPVPASAQEVPGSVPPESVEDDNRAHVLSPMVGTFYHASEPGADPYVSVGDTVESGQVVGIVEAMKLMNPILSEIEGTVVEFIAGNGQPVEFGQRLIAIDQG